jgi:protoporphyrinogen oxidase
LRFRNLVQVLLVVDAERISDANWTYVPDPKLAISRISEYKNMILSMRDRPDTSLGVEIPCWPGDATWTADDAELIERAVSELAGLDLLSPSQVRASQVVRTPNAYPLFELGYDDRMQTIREHVAGREGLHLLGRTAAFEYLDQAGCVRQALEWCRRHGAAGP